MLYPRRPEGVAVASSEVLHKDRTAVLISKLTSCSLEEGNIYVYAAQIKIPINWWVFSKIQNAFIGNWFNETVDEKNSAKQGGGEMQVK